MQLEAFVGVFGCVVILIPQRVSPPSIPTATTHHLPVLRFASNKNQYMCNDNVGAMEQELGPTEQRNGR
jgi:hypothetical protein